MIYIINIDYKKQEDLNMKRKILSMVLLGIMVLGVAGTANAKSKKKYYNTSTSVRNNSYIGVNKAIAIALKKVPGANQSHVYDVHLDRENGRMVYEIEIFYNNSKYEYDIDAVTGEIVGSKIKKYNNWN